ncbi:MAG: potassium channel family protein [Pseudomonadota bacterium]
MEFTLTFLKLFLWAIYFVSPLLLLLVLVIICLGQIVTYLEKWNKFDGLYWSFVTATTVGYGDMRPLKKVSKLLSVLIALTGIIFTGIILAAAVQTVSMSLEKHLDPEVIERMKDDLEKGY